MSVTMKKRNRDRPDLEDLLILELRPMIQEFSSCIVDLILRGTQATCYARTLEDLLVAKGLVTASEMQNITTEAHARAAIEAAFDPEAVKPYQAVVDKLLNGGREEPARRSGR